MPSNTILVIKEVGVKYKNEDKEVSFNEEKEVNLKATWEIPRPPSSSDLDGVSGSSDTKPAPNTSPIKKMRLLTASVNVNETSKHFDGSCLDTES